MFRTVSVGIVSGLESIAYKHARLEALAQLVCGTRQGGNEEGAQAGTEIDSEIKATDRVIIRINACRERHPCQEDH